jgi:hypothetical protein
MLDLTPLIDVVTILLFGVMINAVEMRRKGSGENAAAGDVRIAPADADAAARMRARIAALEKELETYRALDADSKQRLAGQRAELTATLAGLLQLDEKGAERSLKALRELSGKDPESVRRAIEELKSGPVADRVQRAQRRVEEMRKLFTFVDIHLEKGDEIIIQAGGRELGRIAAGPGETERIRQELSRILEAENFNQIVLFLYSFDPAARDLLADRVDAALAGLIEQYRKTPGQTRVYRYGKVGSIATPPGPTGDAP